MHTFIENLHSELKQITIFITCRKTKQQQKIIYIYKYIRELG